jgi:hypothetical protein
METILEFMMALTTGKENKVLILETGTQEVTISLKWFVFQTKLSQIGQLKFGKQGDRYRDTIIIISIPSNMLKTSMK